MLRYRYGHVACTLAVWAFLMPGCGRDTSKRESVSSSEATATVQRGTFVVSVVEDGELAALHQTTITTRQAGTIEWMTEEGTHVKEGDLLAELEKKELLEKQEKNTTELKEAETSLAELMRDCDTQKKDLKQDLAAAEVQLKLAEVKLKRLTDGPTEHQQAQTKADLESALISAKRAEVDLNRVLALKLGGIVSRNEVEKARLEARIAAVVARQAQCNYDKLIEGPTDLEISRAKLAVRTARVSLAMAKEKLDSQVEQLEGEVEEAQANVARLESVEARIERRIALRTIRAPHVGTVVYYQPKSRSSRQVKVGSKLWPGAGVMELPDLRRMKVLTQIAEFHVRHVQVGDPVAVRIPLLADEAFTGKITWIDSWGRDRNENLDYSQQHQQGLSGINVFDCEVALDREDDRLKLGFETKVTIPIKTIEDAVFVPKDAVRVSGRRQYVRVATHGRVEERQVVTGDQSDELIVITSGLTEGETVVLQDRDG